MKWNEGLTMW